MIHRFCWINKNKKAAINPINKKDNKCFQYAATIALNHEQIEKHPEAIAKIKPFINKYIWEKINFPSEKDDWEKIEKNNITIDLNVLYAKKEIKYPAYVSKWKRMALSCSKKKLSASSWGITSKHHGDFYSLNCHQSFSTENKRESIKKYVKINIFVTLLCFLKTLKY